MPQRTSDSFLWSLSLSEISVVVLQQCSVHSVVDVTEYTQTKALQDVFVWRANSCRDQSFSFYLLNTTVIGL